MKTPLSSTSPSERGLAWRHVLLPVFCALAVLPLGSLHLRHFNPQNQLRLREIAAKEEALRRTSGQPRLLICGDSSVLFGFHPETLRSVTGLPTINLGYSAGMGPLALFGVAERAAQPGDTLVLSILPNLLAVPVETLPEGRLTAMMYGHPEIAVGGRTPLIPFTATERLRIWLSAYSPSQRVIINDVGRSLLGMRGFRYTDCVLDEWGYLADSIVAPHPIADAYYQKISPKWRSTLEKFVTLLRARGVRVFYTLPWVEVPAGGAARGEPAIREYLDDIRQVVEVLPEESFPLKEDSSLFADTFCHLTVDNAVERSRQLGQALNAVADHQTGQLKQTPKTSAAGH